MRCCASWCFFVPLQMLSAVPGCSLYTLGHVTCPPIIHGVYQWYNAPGSTLCCLMPHRFPFPMLRLPGPDHALLALWASVDSPAPERHLFDDCGMLRGEPAICKTGSQLRLENLLQVANQSVGQSAQAKPGSKPQDPKPRLLLMGLRRYGVQSWILIKQNGLTSNRSGKSSIASVVFHKMPPNETLFLESTTRIQKDSIQ